MNVLEKILEEIEEATFQEDAPIYIGNMEVDGYVRASRVKDIIRSHMNEKEKVTSAEIISRKTDGKPYYEQIYESRVGDDTLINTNEPSAAALIRAQGQQLRKETVLEYWRRTRGNNNAEMGRNRTEKRIPQGIHKSKE